MGHSGCNEPAPAMEMPTPHLAKRENPMRLVDVVLASVLIGLALGYLNMGNPDAAKATGVLAGVAWCLQTAAALRFFIRGGGHPTAQRANLVTLRAKPVMWRPTGRAKRAAPENAASSRSAR